LKTNFRQFLAINILLIAKIVKWTPFSLLYISALSEWKNSVRKTIRHPIYLCENQPRLQNAHMYGIVCVRLVQYATRSPSTYLYVIVILYIHFVRELRWSTFSVDHRSFRTIAKVKHIVGYNSAFKNLHISGRFRRATPTQWCKFRTACSTITIMKGT